MSECKYCGESTLYGSGFDYHDYCMERHVKKLEGLLGEIVEAKRGHFNLPYSVSSAIDKAAEALRIGVSDGN